MGNRNHDALEKGVINITPVPGLLVMFPSYLIHTVYPFVGEGERRCLPFNAVYRVLDKDQKFLAGNQSGIANPTFYAHKEKNKSIDK